MAITSYNVAPYHDDINIKDAQGKTALDKNYLRILFQPGFAVQTREMNQIQSVLQSQIDRFGSSFYRDGEAVLDGEASFRDNVVYVEVTTPSEITLANLTADILLQPTIEIRTAGITGGQYAKVLGIEGITPEVIRIYLQSISDISDSPAESLNTLVPTGATIHYKEDIQYITDTETTINTSAIATISANGYGFTASVNEGIFYVKGSFVHTPALKRFWIKNSYDEIVRGDVVLTINEKIVTSAQDETLLDNSTGSYNFSGPGADRYSISLDLAFFENSEPGNVLRNIVNQGANFYVKNSQQTFDIARLFTTNERTIESVEGTEIDNLEKKLAKRTFEESGNYTIRPFKVGVREMARVPISSSTSNGITTYTYDGNADPVYTQAELISEKPFDIGTVDEASTKVIFQLDPSTAYINGFRYDFQDKVNIISDKARDSSHIKLKENINISLQQGNYIEIDVHDNPHYQLSGTGTQAEPNPRTNVAYGDYASTSTKDASPTKPWTVDNVRVANINNQSTSYANSKIKAIQFVSSQLRNVRKKDGTNYKPQNLDQNAVGYNLSTSALETAAGVTFGASHNTSPTATYRVYLHNKSTFQDVLDTFPHFVNRKGLTDGTTPYQLGNHSPNELNVLGTQAASNAITVNNTSENTSLFRLPADAVQRVKRVKYTKYKKFVVTVGTSNVTGSFSDSDGKIVEIPLNTSSAVGGLLTGESLVGTAKTDKFDYLVTLSTTRSTDVALRTTGSFSGGDEIGPVNGTFERLVNPRHFEIKDGASSSQVTLRGIPGQDHHFAFKENDIVTVFAPVEVEIGGDDGGAVGRQKILTSHSQSVGAISLAAGTVIELAKADVIMSSIGGTLLTEGSNFEILDDGLQDPEFYRKPKIKLTQSVTFTGADDILFNYYKHGEGDFFCVNSYGNYTSTTEPTLRYNDIPRFNNQPLSEFLDFRVKDTFLAEDSRDGGGSLLGPVALVPNRTCQVDMNYYVGRFDRLIIGDNGVIEIVKGLPAENPVVPAEPENSMTLYTIFMPPYTRSAKTINTRYVNNQRSTMKDITRIKERVSAIEYYSSLSLLESSALQKNLINDDGSSRFKNGIIVDNFTQDKTANALDPNYLAATDKVNGVLRPYFHSNQFRLYYKFPAGLAANRSSAANYIDRSTSTVKDFYVGNSPNNYKFNILTQKIDPTTGRPQQLDVKGFTINTINDINTNGVYTLYNPNTNGFPEYRYISGNVSLSEAPRRIVKATSNAGVTRWEIQSIKADKSGYETLYFSELAGFAGIGAPLPNLVAGGWVNINLESMPNVLITPALEDRDGSESLPESASAQQVDRIVPTGQNNREMLSLWNGSTEELFNQPNASRTVSVQPYEVTVYEGIVKLSPSGDEWVDTTRRPAQIIQDNTAMEVLTFLNQNTDVFEGVLGSDWNNWNTLSQGLQSTSQTFITSRGGFVNDTIAIEEARTGTNTTLESNTTIEESQGDRVVNINIVPFIRSRDVSIYCSGLKPNTRLYFFFDGKDVTRYVAATENFHEYSVHEQVKEYNSELEPDSTVAGGPFQTKNSNHYDLPLFSLAETGEFFGTLRIPNNENMRFRTGLKQFKVTSSSINNEEDADTIAETTYSAFGLNQTIEETITSTRVPEIVTTQISERRVRTRQQQRWLWRRDPVAQTFTIPERYGDGVCVTDIDIFFAEKPSFPIDAQVYLVPTESGIPTNKVIPGSRISLPNSQVNVPANGRDETDPSKILPTNFKFDYPIHLKAGCEYAVVVFSPSPDYRVWVAELGRPNIMNANIPITTNSDIGVLLKSQNTKTWTADQTKDLMFRLNKGIFKLSHTFEFNTKGSNEDQQGIGEPLQIEGGRNIKLSSFNIAADTLEVPGTTLAYDIDFNTLGGNNLTKQIYGIPDTILPKTTYELTTAIDTYQSGSQASFRVNNIAVKATMTGKDRGDGFSDITPMIDLDTHSLFTFDNVLETSAQSKVDAATYSNIIEARQAQLGFITKNVKLTNPADELKIFMKTNRLARTGNLEVYAKVRGVGDDCPWGNKHWEKCSVADLSGKTEIDVGGYSPSIVINGDMESFSESEFILKAQNIPRPAGASTYINDIIEYALKIGFVNNTSDSAKIVKVKDLRVIATA